MTGQLRRLLADQIRQDVPGLKVFAYPLVPTNVRPGREVVTVWREQFTPSGNGGTIGHRLAVNLIGAGTGTEQAEDDLDAALDRVCVAILATGKAQLGDPERQVFYEKYQGWHIPVTMTTADYLTAELRHPTTTTTKPDIPATT